MGEEPDNFLNEVGNLGYQIIKSENSNFKAKSHCRLIISRYDKVTWDEVNGYVWELVELSNKYDGEYDGWETEIIQN